MKAAGARFRLSIAAIVLTVAVHGAAHAACEDLVAAFDRAVAANAIDGADRAAADIAKDIVCGARMDEFQERLVEFLIARAVAPSTSDEDRQRAVALAQKSLEITGTWRNAQRLANYFMRRGERMMAHAWYEKSMALQSAPGTKSTPAEQQSLRDNMAAAKLLANDDREGKLTIKFVPSTRDALNGKLGGIYAPIRGAVVVAIPLPINFYTDQTKFTPAGEQAINELADAAREQQVRTMKLVGHADPRGSAQHNMDLSKGRAEAVREALRGRGINIQFVIDWKGAQQPVDTGVLSFVPTKEEIWALDRRVEWVRDNTTP